MILDDFIPNVALWGTRLERLKCALTSFTISGFGAWATNDFFQPGRSPTDNSLGVVTAGTMCVSTFKGTYSLISAMEPDTP
jgi:hypothetical protein